MKNKTGIILLAMLCGFTWSPGCRQPSTISQSSDKPFHWPLEFGFDPHVEAQLVWSEKDSLSGYESWILRTRSPIRPPLELNGVKILNMPLSSSVELMEKLSESKLDSPRNAVSTEWSSGSYAYQGLHIELSDGEICLIKRNQRKK